MMQMQQPRAGGKGMMQMERQLAKPKAANPAPLAVKRKEMKYFISKADYIAMKSALGNVLQRDKHDKGKGYFIRSLYFDSLQNKAFEEKMAGVEKRKKIRLRLYDFDSDAVKLEIKSKAGSSILKESLRIKRKDAMQLQQGNYDALLEYDSPVARKAFAEFTQYCHRPVVVIDYERDAFAYDFNNIRVTFDRCIRANGIDLNIFDRAIFMRPLLSEKLVVLEIKFDGFIPEWLKSLLRMNNCNSAISKYCIGRLGDKIGWI